MKWHIMCLVTVFLLFVSPIRATDVQGAGRDTPSVSSAITVRGVFHHDSIDRRVEALWQAVVLAYGAYGGRVTLCRWRLRYRHGRPSSRNEHPIEEKRHGSFQA